MSNFTSIAPVASPAQSAVASKYADELYESLKQIIQGNPITLGSVVSIAVELMKLVENCIGLKGPEKKALVIHTLRRFISDEMGSLDPSIKDALLSFVDFVLPTTIDVMMSIANKETFIKAEHWIVKNLCCCCK